MRRYLLAVLTLFALAWIAGAALGPYAVGDSEQYLRQAQNLEAGRPPYAALEGRLRAMAA
mgnify:CR=1 FL=1